MYACISPVIKKFNIQPKEKNSLNHKFPCHRTTIVHGEKNSKSGKNVSRIKLASSHAQKLRYFNPIFFRILFVSSQTFVNSSVLRPKSNKHPLYMEF